jgi:hypothetical protein
VFSDLGTGITLTNFPSNEVKRGSTQHITWSVPTNVTLQSVKVELFQNNQVRKGLGSSNQDVRNFDWQVSNTAPLGDSYLIRVTGVSTTGRSAWANTPYFNIVPQEHDIPPVYLWGLIAGIVLLTIGCIACNRNRSRQVYTHDPPNALPVYTSAPDNPVQTGVQPVLPVYTAPPRRSGYSGGTVAAAGLAGFVGGSLLEGSHHHHHHQIFDTSTTNDFGTGTFGLDSDGGGGASSGSFF